MDDLVNLSAIDTMTKLFVLVAVMIVVWLLEAVWTNGRRWLIPIFFFPPMLIIAAIKLWRHMRGRCFFAASYLALVLLISGVVKYNFALYIWILLRDTSIWPYYLIQYLLFPTKVG